MSIIGINGRIGSGKDTVGSIIQYLTSECGDVNNKSYRDYETFLSRGGGSDPRQHDFHYQSNWEIKKFAAKLKEVAAMLTRVRIELFEDQDFKKQSMGEEWNYQHYREDKGSNANHPMTYRDFLQKLGTDAMRNGLHTNVWVNALMADYHPPKMDQYYPSKWVITDMRFPNEFDIIKSKQGITIRVKRTPTAIINGVKCFIGTDGLPEHASETALDKHTFDYYIVNDGTIEELIQKVKQILKEEGIL